MREFDCHQRHLVATSETSKARWVDVSAICRHCCQMKRWTRAEGHGAVRRRLLNFPIERCALRSDKRNLVKKKWSHSFLCFFFLFFSGIPFCGRCALDGTFWKGIENDNVTGCISRCKSDDYMSAESWKRRPHRKRQWRVAWVSRAVSGSSMSPSSFSGKQSLFCYCIFFYVTNFSGALVG